MRQALKNFIYGFAIQLLFKNMMLILNPAKLLRSIRKPANLYDCTRFGLFIMCFNTLYKLVLCLLRRAGSKKDTVNAPIAGFISGLSLMLDDGSRR
jgi:hypothetical protein